MLSPEKRLTIIFTVIGATPVICALLLALAGSIGTSTYIPHGDRQSSAGLGLVFGLFIGVLGAGTSAIVGPVNDSIFMRELRRSYFSLTGYIIPCLLAVLLAMVSVIEAIFS